ncbi:MAG: M20/M25/M40 family metallo-hydrolase [Myxococcales bacterium]|nr:M20/M25/M40 family metallo-hydrolase [Myxococcales bacterium]MCB9718665.1 M20/M25/M40 family metallo-hydrolase [Myxococcales bacterium]
MRARSVALVLVLGVLGACRPEAMEPGSPEPRAAPSPVTREPACLGDDPLALQDCVSPERYEATLRRVVGPRPPGSTRWREVQGLCDSTLSELGFSVERHAYPTGTNVVGRREGTRWPEQSVMLGAHYDHIPGCPGADDNASGVAGILEAARVLSAVEHPRSLVVACWDEEERGLVGSRAWAARARERGEQITVYLNLDAIAFADARPGTQRIPTGFELLFPDEVLALEQREHRADFITVVTDEASEPWARHLRAAAARDGLPMALLSIPALVQRTHVAIDLQRSDHAALWDQGYPAIMITDTAEYRSDAYHCMGRPDTIEGLDLGFATRVVRATTFAAAMALQGPEPPA